MMPPVSRRPKLEFVSFFRLFADAHDNCLSFSSCGIAVSLASRHLKGYTCDQVRWYPPLALWRQYLGESVHRAAAYLVPRDPVLLMKQTVAVSLIFKAQYGTKVDNAMITSVFSSA